MTRLRTEPARNMFSLPTEARHFFFSRPSRLAKDGPPRPLFNGYRSPYSQGMTLTHLHLAPSIRIVDLHHHSPVRRHGEQRGNFTVTPNIVQQNGNSKCILPVFAPLDMGLLVLSANGYTQTQRCNFHLYHVTNTC